MKHRNTRTPIPWSVVFTALLAFGACVPTGEEGSAETAAGATVVSVSVDAGRRDEAASVDLATSEPSRIDPPASPGSLFPALAAEEAATANLEAEILMTWLEPGDDSGSRLKFARLTGSGWTVPITIAEPVVTLGPRDRASLTVMDTQAVRRTLIARTGDVVARSGDGGRTWSRLPGPLLPFGSFAGGDEGAYAFWLTAEDNGSQNLLGTRVLTGETLLDRGVATGSGTSAAMTWDGPIVVFRSERGEGAEEITIVRRQDARWTEPRTVHSAGGPLSSTLGRRPQVAVDRRRVAVAWSGVQATGPRVMVAFSSDAGRTFGAPIEVAETPGQRPGGPVDVALGHGGEALVLWMTEAGTEGATLNLRRVFADGGSGDDVVIASGLELDPRSAPQLHRAGSRLAATWLGGVPPRVRAMEIPLAAVSATAEGLEADPGVSVAASNRPTPRGRGRVGDLIPEQELVSLSGEPVSFASLSGRPLLLNLWATWCRPCISEMPELISLHEQYASEGQYESEGLVMVGVTIDGEEAFNKVEDFVADLKIPFAVWLDPEMELYGALRVRGLPTTLVVDSEGIIVFRRDQAITADDPELSKALEKVLNGS